MKKVHILLGMVIVLGISFVGHFIKTHEVRDAFAEDKLIRLRIIANSDSFEDQLLKRKIRDKVIAVLGPSLKQAHDLEEARIVVMDNLDDIVRLAEQEIEVAGKDYQALATLGQCPFPTKSYGELNFPAGNYEALKIVLGEGKGQNWWCVLFPPLCFVDVRQGLAADRMADKEIEKLTLAEVNKLPVEVRFKTIELLKKADKRFAELFTNNQKSDEKTSD